jgi:DNA replication protein DnaC
LPNKARSPAEIPAPLREAIRRLVAGELPWPLLILGPAGLGKTCAALALLDHCSGFYYPAPDLAADLIRAQQGRLFTATKRPVHPEGLWDELATAALVVLDEIGSASKVSDFSYECVKRLLDRREGLPLVCISNLDLERLDAVYDERVTSRLAAGTVLTLAGQDRRLPVASPETRTASKTARRTT